MKKEKLVNVAVKSALAAAVLLGASGVAAYEAGDMIVRAGAASVQPDDSSSALKNIPLGGPSVNIPRSEVGVDHGEALGITFTYMLNSDWGVDILVASPFKHDITVNLGNGDWLSAGSVKQLPPTVSLQYFPMDADSKIQPYIGFGLNYTTFFQEDLGGEVEDALGGGDMELDDSFGASFQLGVDYQISENWVLNAAVWKMDIDTDAKITDNNGNVYKTDVDIDPMVYMLSVGYKF
jgi:outer membrane protein